MNLTHQELEGKAAAATNGELRLWLRDSRKDARVAAARELKSRGQYVPPGVARSRRAAGAGQFRQG